MTRRIVLLDLPWARDKDPRLPLGHACLLAALHAHERCSPRSLVVPANDPTLDIDALCHRILTELEGERNDAELAIGVYVWSEAIVRQLLPALRERGFDGRIILGGPQISYARPGVAGLYPEADVFVRGYAEAALVALLTTPGHPRVPGVLYRSDLVDHAQQAELELDATPSPWLNGVVPVERGAFVRWETQRGCPYRCSFCQHREAGPARLRQLAQGDRIEREIRLFCAREVGELAVLDPIFNTRQRGKGATRAANILQRFAELGYRGRISLQCRAELADEPFLRASAALDAVLEFGLQTVEPQEWEPIQRGNKLERVSDTLAACRRAGIDHQVSLIFGLPEQTLDSFARSLDWCLRREVPVIKAFPLMLLRGTELERQRERWSLRETDTPLPIVCGSSSFDERDWLRMAQLSQALRMTEGNHPRSIEGLRALARDLEHDETRWTPPRREG